MDTQIRTRFAPSPTGSLHIGGIRTAIFNWAFARHHNGKFYLRIDDTDAKRNVAGIIEKIFSELRWIGLDWDAATAIQGLGGHRKSAEVSTEVIRKDGHWKATEPGIVYQSLRESDYLRCCNNLVRDGFAYYCFCPKEDLDNIYGYPGTCRPLGTAERTELQFRGVEHCIRLNVSKVAKSLNEKITFHDMIVGNVSINVGEISDPVIMRNNGQAMYSLATTVDDHEMGITHVIRGQEHLTNTFIQILLYRAIGAKHPRFAHIPFICAPDTRRKLSKRDSIEGITVDQYIEKGYLPDALFNYLSHLGWSMDGEQEKWTKEEFVKHFGFKRVVKNPAGFDPDKLSWLQLEYMKELPLEKKVEMVGERYQRNLSPLIEAMGDRLRVISDIEQYRHFFDDESFSINDDALANIKENSSHLKNICNELESVEWDAATLEKVSRDYCIKVGIKAAVIIHALRAASTGTMVGISVFSGLEILGKERCLNRINMCLKK